MMVPLLREKKGYPSVVEEFDEGEDGHGEGKPAEEAAVCVCNMILGLVSLIHAILEIVYAHTFSEKTFRNSTARAWQRK
jgi:hypothetical protein